MSYWENNGMSNEWYTPKYIFDALGKLEFDLDVSAPIDRRYCCVPAKRFITENSLSVNWDGFIWMNPPFGGRNEIDKWLKKFISHNNGIALTPDRTSVLWWQNMANNSDAILFIYKKVKFIRYDGSIGIAPSTGTTLFALGSNAVTALMNASKCGLGFLIIK